VADRTGAGGVGPALEMLREFDEDLAYQRRELMLPEEL
jgi:hypothetical protein